MARAHYADTLLGTSGTGALSLLSGASVLVCDQGTTTPITQIIYNANMGGTALDNPLTTDTYGLVEFWLDTAARVTLVVTKTGYTTQTRTVDVEDAPGTGGGLVPVFTNEPVGCDGVETTLTLPTPASTVSHRTIYAQVPDPDPDEITLAIGASGTAPALSTLTVGTSWNQVAELWFVRTDGIAGRYQAANPSGGGDAGGFFGYNGAIPEWTLRCVLASDAVTPHVFPAGTIVQVWDQ